jgi:aryl sulfotransferase
MEHILVNLFHHGEEVPVVRDVAPWLEFRFAPGIPGGEYPAEEAIALLERQTHRRQIKTHLPLNCLPYYPAVRYIVVEVVRDL